MRRLSFLLMLAIGTLTVVARADTAAGQGETIPIQVEQLLQEPFTTIGDRANLLFDKLALDETLKARDLLLAAKATPYREAALLVLIQHWARFDGPNAYAYAQNQPVVSKIEAMQYALYGWASYAPEKSWDELMVASNRGADRRFNLMGPLDVIAAANLDLALRLYEDLLPDRSCLRCCASRLLIAAARTGDFDKIFNGFKNIPAGPAHDALRDEYWEHMGAYLPEWGQMNLKAKTDETEFRPSETNFCKGWAYTGFDDCMEYILKQPPSRQDELILVAVQSWAGHARSGEVARFVKTLPADLAERSLLGLATSLASLDPKVTLDWVKTFAQSGMRTQALGDAMTRWARIEPEAAHEYIGISEDLETSGILLWNYLLAKLANHTLDFREIDEADRRYNLNWRVQLFEQLALKLADPSINNGGKYDLSAFTAKVQARTDFTAEVKTKILFPLQRR